MIKHSFSSLLLVGTCLTLAACGSATTSSTANLETSDLAVRAKAGQYVIESDKSISLLERLYKTNPEDEIAAIEYAHALREDNAPEKAEVILEPFAKTADGSSLAKSEYAAIMLAQGDYTAAEKYAQQAVLKDEANFNAYHRLGVALDAQASHEAAERAYRKGLELWQGDPTTIMNNLALNLASQGFLDESIEILRKAQTIAPDRIEIERNLRIVTALQQTDGAQPPKPHRKPESLPESVVQQPVQDFEDSSAIDVEAVETVEPVTAKEPEREPEPEAEAEEKSDNVAKKLREVTYN